MAVVRPIRRMPFGGPAVVMLRFEMEFCPQGLIQFAHHMHRQTHRACLIHDRALDALAHPPRRVCPERGAEARVVAVECLVEPARAP